MTLFNVPQGVGCEAKTPLKQRCMVRATHVYGPECEATTGKLMYLCALHTQQIEVWRAKHLNDPVLCPTHGDIGPVKSNLILMEMPR